MSRAARATAPEWATYLGETYDAAALAAGSTRVYLGHEFCERLLPTVESFSTRLREALRARLAVSFVTPYVTERGLRRLGALCATLAELCPDAEVVFSDWGTLRMLRSEFPSLVPVLGRLLIKMKSGSRIAELSSRFNAETASYFRTCSLDVPVYREFLLAQGISRVELDDPLQGLDLDLRGTGISASIYTPYGYIATTRLCLSASCDRHGLEDEVGIFSCRKECRRMSFEIEPLGSSAAQYRKGNTLFYRSDGLPEGLADRGIDRVVVEPGLPF